MEVDRNPVTRSKKETKLWVCVGRLHSISLTILHQILQSKGSSWSLSLVESGSKVLFLCWKGNFGVYSEKFPASWYFLKIRLHQISAQQQGFWPNKRFQGGTIVDLFMVLWLFFFQRHSLVLLGCYFIYKFYPTEYLSCAVALDISEFPAPTASRESFLYKWSLIWALPGSNMVFYVESENFVRKARVTRDKRLFSFKYDYTNFPFDSIFRTNGFSMFSL